MGKTTLELKLKEEKLYWTTDNGQTWGKVGGRYPIMGVGEDYQLVWEAFDDSIYGIEIHFDNDGICENKAIKGNGTDRVKVKSKGKIGGPCTVPYTIKIIAKKGDEAKEFDPDITYPQTGTP